MIMGNNYHIFYSDRRVSRLFVGDLIIVVLLRAKERTGWWVYGEWNYTAGWVSVALAARQVHIYEGFAWDEGLVAHESFNLT